MIPSGLSGDIASLTEIPDDLKDVHPANLDFDFMVWYLLLVTKNNLRYTYLLITTCVYKFNIHLLWQDYGSV